MNLTKQDRAERVRDFINQETKSHSPGIQYVVVNHEGTLFTHAGGFASITPARPLQAGTTMMTYSMSKTITAAAILQLIEQRMISLDDTITKYLPDIPYGKEVLIRHLLSQTSGIPNPIPLKWVHLAEEHFQFNEHLALQAVLKDNAKLDFTPGKKYGYSNISYWLLGQLISKVSGSSYEDYVRLHVFQKLNIASQEIDFIIPERENHSKGYLPKWSFLNLIKSFVIESRFIGEYEDGWLHINDHYLNGPAFGGIVASARAIGVFLQNQVTNSSTLLSAQTKRLFFEQQRNNDCELIKMTFGWHIGKADSFQFFFKEGGGGGFHSEMRIYPIQRIASVVIGNSTSFDVKDFLNTIDKEFLH